MSLRDRLGKINAGSVPPEPNPAMMPQAPAQPINKLAPSGGSASAGGSVPVGGSKPPTQNSASPTGQMGSATNTNAVAPPLKAGKNERLEELKHQIHGQLVDNLEVNTSSEKNWEDVTAAANTFLEQFLKENGIPLSRQDRETVVRELCEEILGLGPLEPLLRDPTISDILINGPKSIFVERFGKLEKSPITFKDNDHLMHIIERIVSAVGRRVDEKTPMVDARLKDGSRFNAIIPPLALDGASVSIRKFKKDAGTLDKLLNWNSMTPAMAKTLQAAVECRLNIIVSGGTGSGKTTLLNSLSACIPNEERVVTIEDAAELQLQQEHVVRLETRPANIEGEGAIPARSLVINALRMRPDRIIIGECRGGETLDMLQAMNTGHDGSLTTLHANTPRDAISRIETMCLMNDNPLPEKAIRQQISSAVHIIVQASRLQDGARKVTSITEVVGMEGEIITMQEIFKFEQTGIDAQGKVIGKHIATGVRPKFATVCESRGISLGSDLFAPDGKNNARPEPNPQASTQQKPVPPAPGVSSRPADPAAESVGLRDALQRRAQGVQT
jgi:pilus assembly protein CpaF